MTTNATTNRWAAAKWALWIFVGVMSLLAGCYVGLWGESEHWNTADAALGEEHEVNFPAHDTYLLTQDALRGDGILYEVGPDNSLETLWRKPEPKAGLMGTLAGVRPRYRSETQVPPEGGKRTKALFNVHTGGIPDTRSPTGQ